MPNQATISMHVVFRPSFDDAVALASLIGEIYDLVPEWSQHEAQPMLEEASRLIQKNVHVRKPKPHADHTPPAPDARPAEPA
jgi:hypothetical protein